MKNKQKVIFFLAVLVIGGLGGVIANQYLFPYLSSSDFWSKYKFLRKSTEGVTVINKTEQVFVKEENTVNKVTSQVASSLVKIISIEDLSTRKTYSKSKAEPAHEESIGFVATSDGLIATDSLGIISENSTYKVLTYDGNVLDGEFIGKDNYSGLAFIKVNASNLTVASFANSNDIKPGEKIIAFGKGPEDDIASFSSSLISRFNRTYNVSGKALSSSENLEGVYSLDGSLGDDYVGGVAADFAGQIVGVIGKAEMDGKSDFFVIPSNKIKPVLDKAIQKSLDTSAILGIYYVSLDKSYSLVNGLERTNGAYIYAPSLQNGLAVLAGSPAEKAGLKIGDIISKIDGKEVNLDNPLSQILYQYKKGDKVKLTIFRNKEEQEIEVVL